ncbi:DUF4189 domain-containing protein [Neisseria sp.]|uniref:DUF4189 domain-containing protein n=1 Tax=Neisseria sp. TaxID=192066 RepID=UPI00359FA96D
MKKLLLILLGCLSLNVHAVHPTQGPLQQHPALCNYGYNPNCNQRNGSTNNETMIIHTTVNVPSKYGALAVNRKTGITGGSLNANSKAEAIRNALRTCEKGGSNAPCKIVTWVRNGCIAGAQGKLGSKWKKFYAARGRGQVESTVMKQCKASGASNCEIAIPEGCSIP